MTRVQVGVRRREVDLAATVAAFDSRSWHGPVHGTVPVTSGYVLVDEAGAPVSLAAELDLTGLSSGNSRRDRDLKGKRFFDAATHPHILVDSDSVAGDGSGWRVEVTMSIAATRCPLTMQVRRDDGVADGFVATVTLDPRELGVTAPRFFVRSPVTLTVSTRLRGEEQILPG